jgi:hypothetical protein
MRLFSLVLFLVFATGVSTARAADELPIFDAHMHYSHDAWSVVPPNEVVEILKKAGIKRAMVSSSNNEGTKMLQDVATGMMDDSILKQLYCPMPVVLLMNAAATFVSGEGPTSVERLPPESTGR